MEKVEQIYKNSGYPAAARLHAIVKSKGIGISGVTFAQIKDFIAAQEVAQLHRKAPKANPIPISVSGKNVEYQIDLLDESAYSSKNANHRWILIVEDVFDRRCAAIPTLKNKSPHDVLPALQEAFRELGKYPAQVRSDSGSEWKGAVGEW
jgi:hypothetical protein